MIEKKQQQTLLIILGGILGGIGGALLGGLLGRFVGAATSTSDFGDLIGAVMGMIAGMVFGDILGLRFATRRLRVPVRLFELILIPMGTVGLLLLSSELLRLNSQTWLLATVLLLLPNIVAGIWFTAPTAW